ncbi:hypothetical protein EDC04DRAFT_2866980 [Pisolithus marmoratus]|nr:hypothetical protein EDC04DRAFT_2866980 [Pisolithus marmoratus]
MREIDEDLPPAYTPAADTALGEETLEVGPQRPFQPPLSQPLPAPPRTMPIPMPTPPDIILSPPTEQPQWHQAPGQAYRSNPQSQSQPCTPQHHTWSSSRMYTVKYPRGRTPGSGTSGGGLIGAVVDTVRDFVDAISAQQVNRGAYASSYPPSTPGPYAQSYAPPATSTPRPVSPTSLPTSPTSRPDVPDDGRPTRVPVPGHPLLRDGMLLVYPKSHTCWKCHNTGYKDYDPLHPCRKCWDKYGKPYAGALAYAPWSSSDSASNSRMQRPLPRDLPQSTSTSGGRPRMGCIVPPPSPRSPHVLQRRSGPSYYIHNPLLGMGCSPPVPHAQPVPPGDPRLGGQKCLKCSGTGVNVVLLFDLAACQRCGGIGRVWT